MSVYEANTDSFCLLNENWKKCKQNLLQEIY